MEEEPTHTLKQAESDVYKGEPKELEDIQMTTEEIRAISWDKVILVSQKEGDQKLRVRFMARSKAESKMSRKQHTITYNIADL